MHAAVIEEEPGDEAELQVLAERVGLDMDLFNEGLASGKYRTKIESSVENAEAKGVREVALFINGKEYKEYPGTFEDLCRAIEKELERLEAGNG